MTDHARAFGFREWPFRVVVDDVFAKVWADRKQLKREIDRRLEMIRELPHSTLQLMWADFGAGKSHTLRHIEFLCRGSGRSDLIPVYAELPPDVDGLRGLFQVLAEGFSTDLLYELAQAAQVHGGGGSSPGARDLTQALRLIASGDPAEAAIGREWLSAQQGVPNLRMLKSHAIQSRIEEDGRVVEVLAEFMRLAHAAGHSLVLMVDEFQRIADLPQKRRQSLTQGLVSLFNKSTTGMHMFLSFSVAQQAVATALIPPALQSRAALFPMLSLPFLSKNDAIDFVGDLIRTFRTDGEQRGLYPFAQDSFQLVIDYAETTAKGGFTPRHVMEVLSKLLFQLYEDSDGSPMLPLQESECKRALDQLAARE